MEKIRNLNFGNLAVELGYTTAERVNECLNIQQKIRELGVIPKKLGEIMMDKSYLSETQVKDIFQKQGVEAGRTQVVGYKILAILGRGAMGTVYKAMQLSMEREVALKILSPHLAGNERFVMKFFKEARSVARLNHPNIIQGIDVGESNGIHYFAMEYIEGKNLEDIIKQEGPMEEKKAIGIILKIGQALEHAHKHNILHRDVKPRNIMISNKDGTIKLCDLGLAQLTMEDSSQQKKILVGTPAYISPEQARGEANIDIRSDIYSLGITFYFCVTGEIPFKGETAIDVMNKHINEQPIPPKQKNPMISNVINTIILKMMAKKREGRYQAPSELIRDLEGFLKTVEMPQNSSMAKPITPLTPAQPAIGKLSEKTLARFRARRLGRLGLISKFRRLKK
ncbi:MAG: serine/threonine-protein kinase [Planctomycetota bacterium]